jgi:hypothetical protein
MSKENRPLGVTIIAVAYGYAAAVAWFKLIRGEVHPPSIIVFDALVISLVMWGLWNLAKWGRVLTIVWSSAAILYGIYTTPHALAAMTKGATYPMAISLGRTVLHGAVLVYLLQPKVAAVFNSRRGASIGIEPENPV